MVINRAGASVRRGAVRTVYFGREKRPPRPRERPGAVVSLMDDPVPARVAGPRTVVRYCPSTRIPLPSHAAAAACLSTSGPPAIRHRRAARCPSLRTRQGPLPVPHDTSRHDLVPATPVCPQARSQRASAAPLAVSGTLPPRALPRSWRTGVGDSVAPPYPFQQWPIRRRAGPGPGADARAVASAGSIGLSCQLRSMCGNSPLRRASSAVRNVTGSREGKAETVVSPTAMTDVLQIVLVQGVVLEQ